MGYRVERSIACDRDLALIFDYLLTTYQELGDPPEDAFARAADRIRAIEDDMVAHGQAPFQDTRWPELVPGLRWVTKNRAILYFQIDEDASSIRILVVFFGGQEHRRQMLLRLSQASMR